MLVITLKSFVLSESPKIVSDLEVDLKILNQVDQEHKIAQNLDDAIS